MYRIYQTFDLIPTKLGLSLFAFKEISSLVKVKAVKTDVNIPIARVIEKPLTGPEAMKKRMIAAIKVVMFASKIADKALL